MFLIRQIQQIVEASTEQLLYWVTQFLPQIFLFLILLGAITRLIGKTRVERLAAKCGSNPILRYLVLPFLSAVVLGNPMAISMGRYLPERFKPAYFASASYHCHTNSGIFQHINPAELFLWLGIANGVLTRGCDLFPLAIRYMCAGLVANFISGYATELITGGIARRQGIHLEETVVLHETEEEVLPAENEGVQRTAEDLPQEVPADENASFHTITIERGDGGYGGPLTITPTQERHVVLYMTGGGLTPEPLEKIVALSGMEPVNGNLTSCPDEQVALAIIDCGGTLRCGIYPGKGIPTVNILATGKSGPLAKYMTDDLYVSAVTSAQVSAAESKKSAPEIQTETGNNAPAAPKSPADSEKAAQDAPQDVHSDHPLYNNFLHSISDTSRIISIFHQSARDAVHTCLEMLLPFMGFAALFIGVCRGTGLTQFLAGLLQPMGGSLPGLLGLGIVCSIPGLSAILGAAAAAAQMFSTVIGDLIASGSIPAAMALPALFAINCQCACDFIPVGLSMTEAKPETTQVGIQAVTLSRFATGWIRILIALLFSIGLY